MISGLLCLSLHPEALVKPGLAALLGSSLTQPLTLHQTRTREEVVNTQASRIFPFSILMSTALLLTKVSSSDPKSLELAQTLHAWTGRHTGAGVGHLQRELSTLETPTLHQKIIKRMRCVTMAHPVSSAGGMTPVSADTRSHSPGGQSRTPAPPPAPPGRTPRTWPPQWRCRCQCSPAVCPPSTSGPPVCCPGSGPVCPCPRSGSFCK